MEREETLSATLKSGFRVADRRAWGREMRGRERKTAAKNKILLLDLSKSNVVWYKRVLKAKGFNKKPRTISKNLGYFASSSDFEL